MALFNFRLPGMKGRDDKAPAPVPPDSVEVMRRRARHRLIGATVLILLGVVGFPLLFDTQPRPIAVDIPITIPDRNKASALALPDNAPPAQTATGQVSATTEGTQDTAAKPSISTRVADAAGLDKGEEVVTPTKPPPKPAPTPMPPPAQSAAKPPVKPEPKPKADTEPAPKPAVRVDEAARVRALLEGKTPDPVAADTGSQRIIVQVGAFADDDKAHEVRMKLERAGLKTYTHVAQTKDGKRTRVRVGPFATRAEADRAAQKIKKLDLPASVLTL